MSQKSPEYRAAEQYTYASPAGTDTRYVIPAGRLGTPYPFLSALEPVPGVLVQGSIGYHCTGISADPTIKGQFLLGHYYAPAVKIVQVTRIPNTGDLELENVGAIAWVKTAWGDDHRIFPSIAPGSDAKRMQIVMREPGTQNLLVSRNGETAGFYRLEPYTKGGDTKWRLTGRLTLEGSHPANHFIESAVFMDDVLYVLRSKQDGTPVWLEAYNLDGSRHAEIPDHLLPPEAPWIYGIAARRGQLYFVKSGRVHKPAAGGVDYDALVPRGIYRGRTLVEPQIFGNGLAIDNWGGAGDGDCYVVQYGDGHGHQGSPSFLIRIPASHFQQ